MRSSIAGAALVLAAMLAPVEASACSSADGDSALIHNALPVDPDPRLIVARVDVEWADPRLLHGRGVAARVTRVIHGDYDGELMILLSPESGCGQPFDNGRSGLVAGLPLRTEGGVLVVEALQPSRGSGYRLPDGYRVPESYLEIVRRREAVLAAKRQ